ncbi:HAD hydrolase family protein [Candidatus Saccharibacteria bacterium]|jgi:hydroxymethylpyrimidine pyrophosphatase-like HAD family hydrolase|nr:HAD hydrolase family protein [Candidatus Saccharibacteria bacterium]
MPIVEPVLPLVPPSEHQMQSYAEKYLLDPDARGSNLLVCRSSHVLDGFSGIDTVYSDADGTLVPEGATKFSNRTVSQIARLGQVGVRMVVVTGKPLSEVLGLVHSMPVGLSADIIYEKGAYRLERNSDGSFEDRLLLATEAETTAVQQLKYRLLEEKGEIESAYVGTDKLTLGWGGQGTHRSILSIDVFEGIPPVDYLTKTGKDRDALKVSDPNLLARVESDLAKFVERHTPGWSLVHLGNGNFEIASKDIDKGSAIQAMQVYRDATGALVIGDSANDLAMFQLRDSSRTPTTAGLVLHRKTALPLTESVDCISFGEANADPHLSLLLAARKHHLKT